MVLLKLHYTRKLGKNNKGIILSRHKEKGLTSFYIPIDVNYFNRINNSECYIRLLTVANNYMYRNTNLILGLLIINNFAIEYRYVLKPTKQYSGNFIKFCTKFNKTYGDMSSVDNFELNDLLYNVEFKPNMPSKLCTAAECTSLILKKITTHIKIKLPSNSRKQIHNKCYAMFGTPEKILVTIPNKAGTQRLLGNRPKVRGSAMNACDHPHGGGEGKSPIGKKSAYSFTGKKTKGIKTVQMKNDYYK